MLRALNRTRKPTSCAEEVSHSVQERSRPYEETGVREKT